MSVIYLTSGAALALPGSASVPKASALKGIGRQRAYLDGCPPFSELLEIWLPWSLRVLGLESPDLARLGGEEIRVLCDDLHAKLAAKVEARPDDEEG